MLMDSGFVLPPLHRSIAQLFIDRVGEYGDRTFMARRKVLPDGSLGDWERLSFVEALARARSVGQWFVDRGAGQDTPLMILSGNGLEHAIMMMGAMLAAVPVVSISSGYSLLSKDFVKLRHCVDICRPAVIFADDGERFAPALAAIRDSGATIVTATPPPPSGPASVPLADLLATNPGPGIDKAMSGIEPDTVARYVFTSGSTGMPKAVVVTQRMMTAVVAQHDAYYLPDADPSLKSYVSWLPWSHIGGVILVSDVINEGATLYIDDGRPLPGQFEESVRNLREISPRDYSGVPILLGELVKAMEKDETLRRSFFRRLRFLKYGTASLSQDIFDRLQAMAVAETGQGVPISSTYGTTETQGISTPTRPVIITGAIGTPFPGVELKLAPVEDKLEIRVRGAAVMPGYLGDPEGTAAAFDEEGFYRTGDAARLADPERPELGLIFDGRITENFKLTSGTWVSVGNLRVALVEAFAPLVQDIVIAGHDREYIALLVWLRAGQGEGLAPELRARLEEKMAEWNRANKGSSTRVERLIILTEPPTTEEIADKGYINQRAVLRRRADFVTRLYADPPGEDVIRA
ncbi:AMP-binding protein [Sphingobium sp. Sx8-8]|uniref:AMP-binding protein n=1 Tax=Sphingobium sp. Sx8-8 TaxID=2933617 RepID=UPI001F5A9DDD|nr:AMP-binding protein [Sphingobium sp. Sx8-8]